MIDRIAGFLALVALIGASAFFSACETSFLSLSNLRLHSLYERRAAGSESLMRLRQSRRRVVIALLIGNNVANIAASALATSVALATYGDEGVGIAIGVMSFLILTFGDIVPKSFATTYGEKIILAVAPIVEVYCWIVTPLVLVFELINRAIPGVYSRATGIERFTEEEVRTAVKLGAAHKGITEREREMIEKVLAFNDKTVSQVMTPKARVMSFPADMLASEAHNKAVHSLYYRFPVAKNNDIIGTVNIRALAKSVASNPNWKVEQVLLPVIKVKASDALNEAFAHLQVANRHFAVVVDSAGKYVGVVTMDDLLEELVGKIKIQ
ncbi:MAG: CNNM domain-containing protein [Candidatus Micrarchaeota archaeon]|nr:CNNM domain-containing protein [Candidatus Micrarchaeota archaeon]